MYWLNLIFRLVTEENYHLLRDLIPTVLPTVFSTIFFGCPSKVPPNCEVIMNGRVQKILAKP